MTQKFWAVLVIWVLLRSWLLFLGYHGSSAPELRERVLQHFSAEDIQRGRDYSRLGFWPRVVLPYLQMAVLLALVFSGRAGRWYDALAQRFPGEFWRPGGLFLLGFFAVMALLALPFSFYLGFWKEHQAGFSNMTALAWFWRYAKGLLISWPIQIAGTLLVLWVIMKLPRAWPALIPFVTLAMGVLLTLIFPVLITPLFYEQKPIAAGPLKEKILAIADRCGIPVEGIYEIDESRYSKHTNAYFSGLFSKKRIVLYDTLIKSHTPDEAALIFAHEAGHWRHDHVFKGISLGFLGTLATCLVGFFVFPLLKSEPAFHLRELWSPANIAFFTALTMMFSLFVAPVEAQISQYMERQADRASLELTGLTEVYIAAEARLARDNHSELLPHPFRVFWLYSHPPAIDRIAMGMKYQEETRAESGKKVPAEPVTPGSPP